MFFALGILTVGCSLGGVYYLFRRYVAGNKCQSKALLNGKTVIITGANTGIGLETAIDLAKRNARVILACRSVERGERAAVKVRQQSGSENVIFSQLDLASLASIRDFAAKMLVEEPHIDILVNNAGVSPATSSRTEDGFEIHMGINHLGHFLLTNLLLDRIKQSPSSSRIVIISSSLYKRSQNFDFDGMDSVDPKRYCKIMPGIAYSQSKLANILFARALCKRLEGSGVCVYVIFPGMVHTEMGRYIWKELSFLKRQIGKFLMYMLIKTPRQGAQTVIHCAMAEELEGVSGRFFSNCREQELMTAVAGDSTVAEKLWTVSSEMVGLGTYLLKPQNVPL